jgi:hypothetical protein
MQDNLGIRGHLDIAKIPGPKQAKSIRIGKRRFFWTDDPGVSTRFASQFFQTNLTAVHRGGDGRVKEVRSLGSGTVTNVGVLSLANDWNWAAPSGAAINTIKLINYHASGTGTQSSAITDIALQSPAAPTATTCVTGTQSLVAGTTGGDAASVQQYSSVATINYTSALAITEWGLFNNATLSSTTGSPFTNGATATSASVTGTPYTPSSATAQGQQAFVFKDTSAAAPFWGLCTSNLSGTVNVPGWYGTTSGSVSAVNPVFGDSFQILPICFDHQVFSAINVVNLDSVQFSFTLQIVSGG